MDIVYTKYLGSRLDEEEEKKVKEIDDDMLYYDLKILLRGVSEEAPPIMKTHFSYEVLPFEVVEKDIWSCLKGIPGNFDTLERKKT